MATVPTTVSQPEGREVEPGLLHVQFIGIYVLNSTYIYLKLFGGRIHRDEVCT